MAQSFRQEWPAFVDSSTAVKSSHQDESSKHCVKATQPSYETTLKSGVLVKKVDGKPAHYINCPQNSMKCFRSVACLLILLVTLVLHANNAR